ncbi:MAG: malate synthase, partial [Deltaproteobacteria bacterium]
MLQNIIAGLDLVMQWSNLLTVLVGVSVGMVMGAIPGLTGTMAIALLVPFSIYLNPVAGIAG